MAAKTYGQIFEAIRLALNYQNTFNDGSDDTALIKQKIYNTEKFITKKYQTNLKKSEWIFNSQTGVNNYVLPTGFSRIDRGFYKFAGSSLEYPIFQITPSLMQESRNGVAITSNRPLYWNVEGQKLQIYPNPQDTSVEFHFIYSELQPTIGLSASSNTDINTPCNILEGFEELIELRVLSGMFLSREQANIKREYENDFNTLFDEYKQAVVQQNTDNPLIQYRRNIMGNRIYAGPLYKS